MEMELAILWKVIPYLITLAIGIFGTYWVVGKGKIAQIKRAVDVISEAVEDNSITEDEAKAIVMAVREVIGL